MAEGAQGLRSDQAERQKELERKNARWKKLVAKAVPTCCRALSLRQIKPEAAILTLPVVPGILNSQHVILNNDLCARFCVMFSNPAGSGNRGRRMKVSHSCSR